MSINKKPIIILVVLLLVLPIIFQENAIADVALEEHGVSNIAPDPIQEFTTSSVTGSLIDYGEFLVIHQTGQSIESKGAELTSLLNQWGVSSISIMPSELESSPPILSDAPCLILDASLGSENASLLTDSFIQLLIQYDRPIVVMGRAAWLLHRLHKLSSPTLTMSVATTTQLDPTDVVYLSYPYSIDQSATLTSESLELPKDRVQSVRSRIITLTGGETSNQYPILRYDSFPLDTFLLGQEDPTLWTTTGEEIFINIVAYSTALGESTTSDIVSTAQSNGTIGGGFAYGHEPCLEPAYYSVHIIRSLLSGTEWTDWSATNSEFVENVLTPLYVDNGTHAWFLNHFTDTIENLDTTAMGLWLVETMSLSSSFDSSLLSAYLADSQKGDGGFSSVPNAFFVLEALNASGSIGLIDSTSLYNWLVDCRVNSDDTSDAQYWGGIAKSPYSALPKNQYSALYLQCLEILEKSHPDILKLVDWILDETQQADGSFSDRNTPDKDVVRGTSSALTSLEMLGYLSPENRTSSLGWLEDNQLPSGGFGTNTASLDIVGKPLETFYVATTLNELNEISSTMANRISDFVESIRSDTGFEGMEMIPSLLWGDWLGQIARFSHAGTSLGIENLTSYYQKHESFSFYMPWTNVTVLPAEEYMYDNYRTKSVWSIYHGLLMGAQSAIEPKSGASVDSTTFTLAAQYPTGHFRLYAGGSAHMQYTVAAVESLYLLDEIDSIYYRSALDSQVLAMYSSGSWSDAGWTLRPYTSSQSAIDWLSTRTALRLGLIDQTMASEIASVIESRIQYSDLWDLSRDVATLALLNESFSIDLESIDSASILSTLGSSPFSDGWYNESAEWQPVVTAGVLEMLSIFGLRTEVLDITGNRISGTSPDGELGDVLEVTVSITSSSYTHDVILHAFGHDLLYEDVGNSDILLVNVPSSSSYLGIQNISLMLLDRGDSRAFNRIEISINTTMTGFLTVDTPEILLGDLINGSVSWTLENLEDVGECTVIIRLGDPPSYQQWTEDSSSPYSFSIPTVDFDPGVYNLSVFISREFCTTLVLREEVTINSPIDTYIESETDQVLDVGDVLQIPILLRFSNNDSLVASQNITLTIRNSIGTIVHTDYLITEETESMFDWTPDQRGSYSFDLVFERNGTLEGCEYNGAFIAMENATLQWILSSPQEQYSMYTTSVLLQTINGAPLVSESISILVKAPSGQTIIDSDFTTNSSGHIEFSIVLGENGIYTLDAEFLGKEYVRSISNNTSLVSWSSTNLVIDGIPSDGLVNDSWTIWAQLSDSIGQPIVGEAVTLRVTLLPSTIVYQTTLTTNSTGHVSTSWSSSTPGSFQYTAEFAGTLSLDQSGDSRGTDLYIPVQLVVQQFSSLQVGFEGWVLVYATDHTQSPVSGVLAEFVVRDPSNSIIFQTSGIFENGYYNVSWTPSVRGVNNFTVSSDRQSWFEAACNSELLDVFESSIITCEFTETLLAPARNVLQIEVLDTSSTPVSGIDVSIIITLNGLIITDVIKTTNIDGSIEISVDFNEPGELEILTESTAGNWLLESGTFIEDTVLGKTTIDLLMNGLPISQGKDPGILVEVISWDLSPLNGAHVNITIERASDGSLVTQALRTTGMDGRCAFAHSFNEIGDFIIRAVYMPSGINAENSTFLVQRVTVVPDVILIHPLDATVGGQVSFEVGILDNLDSYVPNKSLQLAVIYQGNPIFESQVESDSDLVIIHWTASQRGSLTITLSVFGGTYCLANSTSSVTSCFENVSSELTLNATTIDLFESVLLEYQISTSGDPGGIAVIFEVLDVNLLPVWDMELFTNESGYVSTLYVANDTHGILKVRVAPNENQYLSGGMNQIDLTVKTSCIVDTNFNPYPPIINEEVNVTINIDSELGSPIDGLTISVRIRNPSGVWVEYNPYVSVIEGLAWIVFTPENHGAYLVRVAANTEPTTHSFTIDEQHTVFHPTSIDLQIVSSLLQVNDNLTVSAQLFNSFGVGMSGMRLTIELNGKNPVELTTNETGMVTWISQISDEGYYIVSASFTLTGVYLSSVASKEIHVRQSTQIQLSYDDKTEVIAELISFSAHILLEDIDGAALEGNTVYYSLYHDELGIVKNGSFIQPGPSGIDVDITIHQMGDYTLVFYFTGTEHYHPSSTALDLFVRGTSLTIIDGIGSIPRNSSELISIEVLDEIGFAIDTSSLSYVLNLSGPTSSLDGRITSSGTSLYVNITGLPIGSYTLNTTVIETIQRLGSSAIFEFNVTTCVILNEIELYLPGLVGEEHIMTLQMVDSYGENVTDIPLYVSLYDSEGREIFGSSLSKTTKIDTVESLATISWTPLRAGNYTLHISCLDAEFIVGIEKETVVWTRHKSTMSSEGLDSLLSTEGLEFAVILKSGSSGLRERNIIFTLILNNELYFQVIRLTNYGGQSDLVLDRIPAGNLTIEARFLGDSSYSSCEYSVTAVVQPVISVIVEEAYGLYLGVNSSVTLSVSVHWLQMADVLLEASVYDSVGNLLINTEDSIGNDTVITVYFVPTITGNYSLLISMQGIPVINNYTEEFRFMILEAPIQIPLDAGITPILGSGMILTVIAFVVRKKLNTIITDLPTEWES